MARFASAPAFAAFALLLVALPACGGKSNGTANGNDAGKAGQSTGGSSNTGGTSHGGTSNGGSSGGGATAVCERYDDDSPISVNVEMINKTAKTIYLGQRMVTCDQSPLFSVEDISGKPLPSPGFCRQSCLNLRREGAGGCPAICLFPAVVELAPGTTHHTTWDSLYLVNGSLPNSCLPYDAGDSSASCDQAKRIEPGSFVFKASAGHGIDCSQTSPGSGCNACSIDGSNGGCTTQGALVTGDIISAQAEVLLDEQYGYYKPIAPSSDNDSSADAAPAPGALNQATVQLIFTE